MLSNLKIYIFLKRVGPCGRAAVRQFVTVISAVISLSVFDGLPQNINTI